MGETVGTALENLGEKDAQTFLVVEHLVEDDQLETKFQALEALSELDRPRTVRAMREILKIFVD
jgi:pantothenate synthetase